MMNKETWCGIYDVKNKLKKGTFYKKDKPQDVERGAGNEKTSMAENQDGTLFGPPYLILDEPT